MARRHLAVLALALGLALGVVSVGSAAWYAKFDGVDGSSKQKDHDKWCNVQVVNLGGHKAGSGSAARLGGRLRGNVENVEVSIVKEVDASTVPLLEACVKGRSFATLLLDGSRTRAGRETYLRYELKNVMITSYTTHGPSSPDRPEGVSDGVAYETLVLKADAASWGPAPLQTSTR